MSEMVCDPDLWVFSFKVAQRGHLRYSTVWTEQMLVTCRRTSLARSLYGVGLGAIVCLALAALFLVVSFSPPSADLIFLSLLFLAYPAATMWFLVEAATKPVLLHVSPDGIRVVSRAFLNRDLVVGVGNISGIYHGPIKDDRRMPTGHVALVLCSPRPNLSIRFRDLTEIECARTGVGRFWRIVLNRTPEPLFFEVPRRGRKYRGLLVVCPDAENVAAKMAAVLDVDTWSIF